MKKVIFFLRIATGIGSSSNDPILAKLVFQSDLDFDYTKVDSPIKSKFQFLNGNEIKEVSIYEHADIIYLKTNRSLSKYIKLTIFGAKTNDPFLQKIIDIELAKGWELQGRHEENEIYKLEQEAFRIEEMKEAEKMKSEGMLLWWTMYSLNKDLIVPHDPLNYKGGFSDEVFKAFLYYVEEPHPGGYVGHMSRRIELDKVIEEELTKLHMSPKGMRFWLTSTDGRHFMDYIEEMTLDEQIAYIKDNIHRIFNRCLIYASSQHKGTLLSTKQVLEDYQKEGILLPEKEVEYENGLVKMLGAIIKEIK